MRLFKRGGIPAGTVVEFWWRQMIPIIVLLGACGLTEIITPLTGLLQILSMVSGFLIWLVALMLVSLYYQRATLYTCARCGKSRRSYEWWVTYSTQHTGYCWTCWQDQVAGGGFSAFDGYRIDRDHFSQLSFAPSGAGRSFPHSATRGGSVLGGRCF